MPSHAAYPDSGGLLALQVQELLSGPYSSLESFRSAPSGKVKSPRPIHARCLSLDHLQQQLVLPCMKASHPAQSRFDTSVTRGAG